MNHSQLDETNANKPAMSNTMADGRHQVRSKLPRIFIGGTGRSGTTILYTVLGTHRMVHSFPEEMRFLVDPDGLISLVDAFTDRYSPIHAREALFRFERLMRVDLNNPRFPPFLGYEIANWLGNDYYWKRLEQFCESLVACNYQVNKSPFDQSKRGKRVFLAHQLRRLSNWLTGEGPVQYRYSHNWPREWGQVMKYFAQREEIVRLSAAVVDDLFLHAAHENHKMTWCEKTPQNLFYIDFLQELFPNSVFIHVTRDPRGVAYSIMKHYWGPNTLESSCHYLENIYKRWFAYKPLLDLTGVNYLEIKLEDLATSTATELARIGAFCGLEEDFGCFPEISLEKVDYWRRDMTDTQIDTATELLLPNIRDMGYDL